MHELAGRRCLRAKSYNRYVHSAWIILEQCDGSDGSCGIQAYTRDGRISIDGATEGYPEQLRMVQDLGLLQQYAKYTQRGDVIGGAVEKFRQMETPAADRLKEIAAIEPVLNQEFEALYQQSIEAVAQALGIERAKPKPAVAGAVAMVGKGVAPPPYSALSQ